MQTNHILTKSCCLKLGGPVIMPHCVVIPSLLNHLNGPKDAKININLTKLQPASVV